MSDKPEVIINGVRYMPVTEANPSVEHICRGLMEQFWGEVPSDSDWRDEARIAEREIVE